MRQTLQNAYQHLHSLREQEVGQCPDQVLLESRQQMMP